MTEDAFDSAAFLTGRGWTSPPAGPRKPNFGLRWLFVAMTMAAVLFAGASVLVRNHLIRQAWQDHLMSRGARILLPGYDVDLTQCSVAEAEECLAYLESTPGLTHGVVVVLRGQFSREFLDDFERRTKIHARVR